MFGSELSQTSSHHVIGHLLLSSPADPDDELWRTAPDAYPAFLPLAPETLRHLALTSPNLQHDLPDASVTPLQQVCGFVFFPSPIQACSLIDHLTLECLENVLKSERVP